MPLTRRRGAREVRPDLHAPSERTRAKRILGTPSDAFQVVVRRRFSGSRERAREEQFCPVFRLTDARRPPDSLLTPVPTPPGRRHARSRPARVNSPTPWRRPTRTRTRRISPITTTTTTTATSPPLTTTRRAPVCGAAARRSSRLCSRDLAVCGARSARVGARSARRGSGPSARRSPAIPPARRACAIT